MKDQKIELPEPKYPGTKADIPNAIPDLYTAEQVRTAIEADRQRRGEQRVIGRIKLDGNRHPRAELSTGYDENGDQWKEGTPIYAAPQPAEPYVAPMSDKPVCGAQNAECETQTAEPVKVPSEAWPLVEKYADAVSAYNDAVRIDVGIDKAGQECISIEMELRALLASYATQPQPSGISGEFDAALKTAEAFNADIPVTEQEEEEWKRLEDRK